MQVFGTAFIPVGTLGLLALRGTRTRQAAVGSGLGGVTDPRVALYLIGVTKREIGVPRKWNTRCGGHARAIPSRKRPRSRLARRSRTSRSSPSGRGARPA